MIGVAGVVIATLLAGPALASDRVSTTTDIKILPADHVYRDGDPIRICVGAVTSRVYDGTIKMVIEYKDVGTHGWDAFRVDIPANEVGCLYAVIHGKNNTVFRSRTLNTEDYAGSTSRRIKIDVAPRG